MHQNQRGMVDTCFEEGQYESGIALLDQLRSPRHRPFQPHIRQLIYIALYPPPPADTKETETLQLDSASPSKLHSRLHCIQHGSSQSPSPAATDAALHLLTAFSLTNLPWDLFSALPSYPASALGSPKTEIDYDDPESFVARRSVCITKAKNVWEILKEGFVQRKEDPIAMSPVKKGRRRAIVEEPPEDSSVDREPRRVVGQYSWPILGWLLSIFEKDEKLAEDNAQPRYSSLLLSQIPPPRTKTDARWNVEAPLDIVMYCLEQTHPQQALMGARLLALLINLASTTFIDFPMFLNALGSRIMSLRSEQVASLFAMLPQSKNVMQFKLTLCKNYLAGSSETASRPKPQARAPRPVPARRKPAGPVSVESSKSSTPALSYASGPVSRKYPTFTASEVLELVNAARSQDQSSDELALRMKWELVLTYALLQKQAGSGTAGAEWQIMLRDGRLVEALKASAGDGFTATGGISVQSMQQILSVFLA
ncbi:hypothetical protein BKA93DRAFT_721882 [Sparassis latifolia]